jgi:hypothetical protein
MLTDTHSHRGLALLSCQLLGHDEILLTLLLDTG